MQPSSTSPSLGLNVRPSMLKLRTRVTRFAPMFVLRGQVAETSSEDPDGSRPRPDRAGRRLWAPQNPLDHSPRDPSRAARFNPGPCGRRCIAARPSSRVCLMDGRRDELRKPNNNSGRSPATKASPDSSSPSNSAPPLRQPTGRPLRSSPSNHRRDRRHRSSTTNGTTSSRAIGACFKATPWAVTLRFAGPSCPGEDESHRSHRTGCAVRSCDPSPRPWRLRGDVLAVGRDRQRAVSTHSPHSDRNSPIDQRNEHRGKSGAMPLRCPAGQEAHEIPGATLPRQPSVQPLLRHFLSVFNDPVGEMERYGRWPSI